MRILFQITSIINFTGSAGEMFRIDTIRSGSDRVVKSVRNAHFSYSIASTDSISEDYIDVSFGNFTRNSSQKVDSYTDLTIEKRRALALEELLIERITNQASFNKLVHFGDKVYVVRFRYNGAMYPVYVICNPDNKKVVMDTFFKNIIIHTRK
ncbi:MAG: hypothetical protein WC384_09880 [Prolixibacteraceae bacterium]|jgi:hypothetical protein